jgi:hypothetical protein
MILVVVEEEEEKEEREEEEPRAGARANGQGQGRWALQHDLMVTCARQPVWPLLLTKASFWPERQMQVPTCRDR